MAKRSGLFSPTQQYIRADAKFVAERARANAEAVNPSNHKQSDGDGFVDAHAKRQGGKMIQVDARQKTKKEMLRNPRHPRKG